MIWNWILTMTGINNSSGRWYAFWSGFGSDLGELAIIGVVWRKVNCHSKGCFRIGLHAVSGTPFVTCAKHHPERKSSTAATAAEIAQAHADSLK